MSSCVTTEKMVTKKHRCPSERGCFTITRRPIATNQPGKPTLTIMQRVMCNDDAGRLLAEARRRRPATVVPRHAVSASCDPAIDGTWNHGSIAGMKPESVSGVLRPARSRGPNTLGVSSRSSFHNMDNLSKVRKSLRSNWDGVFGRHRCVCRPTGPPTVAGPIHLCGILTHRPARRIRCMAHRHTANRFPGRIQDVYDSQE